MPRSNHLADWFHQWNHYLRKNYPLDLLLVSTIYKTISIKIYHMAFWLLQDFLFTFKHLLPKNLFDSFPCIIKITKKQRSNNHLVDWCLQYFLFTSNCVLEKTILFVCIYKSMSAKYNTTYWFLQYFLFKFKHLLSEKTYYWLLYMCHQK